MLHFVCRYLIQYMWIILLLFVDLSLLIFPYAHYTIWIDFMYKFISILCFVKSKAFLLMVFWAFHQIISSFHQVLKA